MVVFAVGCKKTETQDETPVGITRQTIAMEPVALGGASNFAVLAGTTITNTGATNITGDLGLSPGSSVTGFLPGVLVGTKHVNDVFANQAKKDLVAAYTNILNRTSSQVVTLDGNIGGMVLTPGLYKAPSSLAVSSGDLTLDALGNANAVFVFQITSTLVTTSGRKIILAGGAQAANVYWQVGSSATFGTNSEIKGTVIALSSITLTTGASLTGRAFAITAAVTMDNNAIVKQDAIINALGVPNQTVAMDAINLKSVANFAILAASTITNTGSSVITGDLGLNPGTSVVGFPPATLNGTQHVGDIFAKQAKQDLADAYADAAGRTSDDAVVLDGNIGGLTLTPGLYIARSSLNISSGDLTFDAKGNANAIFIIQIKSTLVTLSGRKVILTGGAQADNIFWQVGSSATLGTNSVMKGNIMAMTSITITTGATLEGRALALNAAVTIDANTITKQGSTYLK